MSTTINYTVEPGHGPNLDRLTASWRYCEDATTQVPVTFTATRRHDQPGIAPRDVTIVVTGNVRGLLHLNNQVVEVKLGYLMDEDRPLDGVEVTVPQYNHMTQSGELDWIILG